MAETHADILQAAARTALSRARGFQEKLALLAASPESAQARLEAREAFLSADLAFRAAEIAVFYADGYTPEILVMPDPDNSARLSPTPRGFQQIRKLLDLHAAQEPSAASEATITPKEIVMQSLLGATQDLVTSMEQFSAEWDRNTPSNFRQRLFLSSPQEAVRRVFQGYTTMVGSVLYERSATEQGGDNRTEIAASLAAMRNLYLGAYQSPETGMTGGPGMRALIEQTAPDLAKEIEDGFLQSIELAKGSSTEAEPLATPIPLPSIELPKDNPAKTEEPQANAANPLQASLQHLESAWLNAAHELNLEVRK